MIHISGSLPSGAHASEHRSVTLTGGFNDRNASFIECGFWREVCFFSPKPWCKSWTLRHISLALKQYFMLFSFLWLMSHHSMHHVVLAFFLTPLQHPLFCHAVVVFYFVNSYSFGINSSWTVKEKAPIIPRIPVVFAHPLVHIACRCSPKVTPSTASSRNHTSRALPSSRATHLSSSTQASKATHHSSRVMVSRPFSCRGRRQCLVSAEAELVVADTSVGVSLGDSGWMQMDDGFLTELLVFPPVWRMF